MFARERRLTRFSIFLIFPGDGDVVKRDAVEIRVASRFRVTADEKGRDLEKIVLSRAVRWHIENRILLYANKTVIFE
jgi:formyltetrahydrofolate deformylase